MKVPHYDIAVMGAGVYGVWLAHHAVSRGLKVLVKGSWRYRFANLFVLDQTVARWTTLLRELRVFFGEEVSSRASTTQETFPYMFKGIIFGCPSSMVYCLPNEDVPGVVVLLDTLGEERVWFKGATSIA